MKILTRVISLGQPLKSLFNILSDIFDALNTEYFKPQNVPCLSSFENRRILKQLELRGGFWVPISGFFCRLIITFALGR